MLKRERTELAMNLVSLFLLDPSSPNRSDQQHGTTHRIILNQCLEYDIDVTSEDFTRDKWKSAIQEPKSIWPPCTESKFWSMYKRMARKDRSILLYRTYFFKTLEFIISPHLFAAQLLKDSVNSMKWMAAWAYLKARLLSAFSGGSSMTKHSNDRTCTFPRRLQKEKEGCSACKTAIPYQPKYERYRKTFQTACPNILWACDDLQIYEAAVESFTFLNDLLLIKEFFQCVPIFVKHRLNLHATEATTQRGGCIEISQHETIPSGKNLSCYKNSELWNG